MPGARVDLTATDWRLLCLLLDFRRAVLSRERILDEPWPGFGDESGRIVATDGQRLRRKVGADSIATVRGTCRSAAGSTSSPATDRSAPSGPSCSWGRSRSPG